MECDVRQRGGWTHSRRRAYRGHTRSRCGGWARGRWQRGCVVRIGRVHCRICAWRRYCEGYCERRDESDGESKQRRLARRWCKRSRKSPKRARRKSWMTLRECNKARPKRGKGRREGRRRLTRRRAPTSIRTRAARHTMARDRKRVPTIRVSGFSRTRETGSAYCDGVGRRPEERKGSVQGRSETAEVARWAAPTP